MSTLVDCHAHLDFDSFDGGRDGVVDRARDAGVGAIVTVGTGPASSRAAVALSRRYPDVSAVVGIHPHDAKDASGADFSEIEELAGDARVVGVGETGLDYFKEYSPRRDQWALFEEHARMAERAGKALVVHNRDADDDCRKLLDGFGDLPVILHCFSSDERMVEWALSRERCYVSVAGQVTYKKSDALRAAVATVPMERLLVETDCPFLTPQAKRSRVRNNEPAFIVYTAQAVAKLKSVSVDELARATTANAARVFSLWIDVEEDAVP